MSRIPAAVAVALLSLAAACVDDREPASEPGPAKAAAPATTAVVEPSLPSNLAPPSPAASPSLAQRIAWPSRFTALGTEPFWNARVDGTTLIYSTPEDQDGTIVTVVRSELPEGVAFRGTLGGASLVVTLTRGRCSDGMSDRIYPYAATRRLGDDVQRGCAAPL